MEAGTSDQDAPSSVSACDNHNYHTLGRLELTVTRPVHRCDRHRLLVFRVRTDPAWESALGDKICDELTCGWGNRELAALNITGHDWHPNWNYTLTPTAQTITR